MNKDNVNNWLRKEAEKLEVLINKIELKVKQIMQKEDITKIGKLNEYDLEIKKLRATQIKLYEMIGRIDELEE